MKLFNFNQKEPVAFVGNGILLCESQIRFSLSELEKQVNEWHEREIIPENLSIRNLTFWDVLFKNKYIQKEKKHFVFTKVNGHRNCQAVYNKNGLIFCFRLTLRAPVRLNKTIEENPQVTWISCEWTIDYLGNRLLKIDYQKLSGLARRFYLVSREFISIRDRQVVRRKLSYTGLSVEKVETEMYQSDGTWVPVRDKNFPSWHWKQVCNTCLESS